MSVILRVRAVQAYAGLLRAQRSLFGAGTPSSWTTKGAFSFLIQSVPPQAFPLLPLSSNRSTILAPS